MAAHRPSTRGRGGSNHGHTSCSLGCGSYQFCRDEFTRRLCGHSRAATAAERSSSSTSGVWPGVGKICGGGPGGCLERAGCLGQSHPYCRLHRRGQHRPARSRRRIPPVRQGVRQVVRCGRRYRWTPDRHRHRGRCAVQRRPGHEPGLPAGLHVGRRWPRPRHRGGAGPGELWAGPDHLLHRLGRLGRRRPAGQPGRDQQL